MFQPYCDLLLARFSQKAKSRCSKYCTSYLHSRTPRTIVLRTLCMNTVETDAGAIIINL